MLDGETLIKPTLNDPVNGNIFMFNIFVGPFNCPFSKDIAMSILLQSWFFLHMLVTGVQWLVNSNRFDKSWTYSRLQIDFRNFLVTAKLFTDTQYTAAAGILSKNQTTWDTQIRQHLLREMDSWRFGSWSFFRQKLLVFHTIVLGICCLICCKNLTNSYFFFCYVILVQNVLAHINVKRSWPLSFQNQFDDGTTLSFWTKCSKLLQPVFLADVRLFGSRFNGEIN